MSVTTFQIGSMQLNWLDAVLGGIMLIAFIRGVWTGFSRSIASLVGVIAAFWVGGHHFLELARRLSPWIANEVWRHLLSFFLLFIAVYLVFLIAGYAIYHLFKVLRLGWIDRTLGAALGFIKGLILSGVIIIILTMWLPPGSPLLSESQLYPRLTTVAYTLTIFLPEDLRGRFMWNWRNLYKTPEPQKVQTT